MRDTEQEEAFVKAFIVPARRERYLLKLANSKLRGRFLNRLSHNLDVNWSLASWVPRGLHYSGGVARLLNERGVKDSDPVYVISNVSEIDEQHLAMRLAVEEILQLDFNAVICCVPGVLAYYQPEDAEIGYILE